MNLPNTLTVSRVVLTFVFLFFILADGVAAKLTAALVFTLGALTDYFDGYFARRDNIETDFGKIMDPIADKFFVLSTFFVFTYLGVFPGWIFWLIFIREVLITAIRLYAAKHKKILAAEGMGKLKTVFQIVSVFVMLLYVILLETTAAASFSQGFWSIYKVIIFILMLLVMGITLFSGGTFLRNNWKFYRV